ncbi:MAG: hypothetical protein WDN31_05120 [Hyphomicrobium sp.]
MPDHIGCVAVTPEYIIGGNWDSKDFYFWDHQGKLIRKVTSETANPYQDIKVIDGKLVGAGSTASRQGAVDWLDLTTASLIRRLPVGNTDHGDPLTRGRHDDLPRRPVVPAGRCASRLFVFPLPAR